LQTKGGDGTIRNLKRFVDVLAKIPLCQHPGSAYEYGLSFDVLGRVLEVITGKSLDVCLKERVFVPLGMQDTFWGVPRKETHRMAACYAGKDMFQKLYGKKVKPLGRPKTNLFRIDGCSAADSNWVEGKHCRVLAGGGFMGYLHGGLVSTAADTGKFVRMLLNRGVMDNGKRLLKTSTVAAMEKNRLKKNEDGDRVCFLGNIGTFREGGDDVGMGGAACTYWNIDRKDETATVYFTQHLDMPDTGKEADLWNVLHKAVKGGKK
jgi:CubicO group peptidase (beta-lactamase class C family)